MNSKRKCQSCKAYRDPSGMIQVGLGYVCDELCRDDLQRRRNKGLTAKPQIAKKTSRSIPVPSNMRTAVLLRDGNKCRVCSSYQSLHIHHITYRSGGGGNEFHNLITLCDGHHALVHSNKRQYQPLLRGMMWRHLVLGVFNTLPQFERWLSALRKGFEIS